MHWRLEIQYWGGARTELFKRLQTQVVLFVYCCEAHGNVCPLIYLESGREETNRNAHREWGRENQPLHFQLNLIKYAVNRNAAAEAGPLRGHNHCVNKLYMLIIWQFCENTCILHTMVLINLLYCEKWSCCNGRLWRKERKSSAVLQRNVLNGNLQPWAYEMDAQFFF